MKTHNFRSHTILFRVVSTFVFILLLITTVSSSYAADDNVLVSLMNQLNSLLFGTQVSPSSTSAIAPGDSTLYCAPGGDPSTDPPPPPKP